MRRGGTGWRHCAHAAWSACQLCHAMDDVAVRQGKRVVYEPVGDGHTDADSERDRLYRSDMDD